MATRNDERRADQLRPVCFTLDYQHNPLGSVLITMGQTRVICSVTVEDSVPRWMSRDDGRGWVTAEYQMLPGATAPRSQREVTRGRPSGRSSEIQRLIGRSLRAAVDLTKVPGRTFYVDCDVLDADGGTRCAAITGSSVALELALRRLLEEGKIRDWPMLRRIAAVSVGVVEGETILDLCYTEDSRADVDMNVVMTSAGHFVEVQGTAEDREFSRRQLDEMLGLAETGIGTLFELQNDLMAGHSRQRT